jgi:hypothetical protein
MNKNILIGVILIITASMCRVYQPIYNFAPIVAISLFSGYVFKNKKTAISIALIASLLGDLLISYINKYPLFHNTFAFVYGSYILIALLGNKLYNAKLNWNKLAILGVSSSLLFFIITNLGVWLVGNIYNKNIDGLIDCFVAAIPFYKHSFLSDLIYIPVIFGAYSILRQKSISLTSNYIS